MEQENNPKLSPITVENYAKGSSVRDEEAMYAQDTYAHEKFPNSIFIPLWKRGHISWHSESSASVLALLMLFFLLLVIILLSIIASFSSNDSWITEILKLLGQAVTAVIGAVVGASAVSGNRIRRK